MMTTQETESAGTDLRTYSKAQLVELLTTDLAGWNRLFIEARRASNHAWRANLSGAHLSGADLSRADLSRADLSRAYLEYHDALWPYRANYFQILDAVPGEVLKLREQILAGNINGSVYEGECACLCGTIANDLGVAYTDIPGVKPNGSRPAEQWFYPINQGDVPVIGDEPKEWASEGVYRASVALAWLDEWVASRTMIAGAFVSEGTPTNDA